MDKTVFQIFDEMNREDAANGSKLISMGVDVVSATYSKSGTKVTVGIGGNHTMDLMDGKSMAVLLIIDRQEYSKRSKSNS